MPSADRLPINPPQEGLFAGVDVGGTNQSVAFALGDGTVVGTYRRRTPLAGTAMDALSNVLDMFREGLAAAHKAVSAPSPSLIRVGIGFGGPVDQDAGTVIDSHHVPGWRHFPLRDTVAREVGAPVVLDNDANAAAMGEAKFGAGLVIGGRLYRGRHGMAGEIGHVTVVANGPRCDCGKRGCLEALASGRGIGRRAREEAAQFPVLAAGLISRAGGEIDRIESTHVFEAAASGDQFAIGIVEETAGYLGLALGNAANLLDPGVIVIGGGVAETGDVLLGPVRRAVADHCMPGLPVPDVLSAALGYDAGVLGGLALAFFET